MFETIDCLQFNNNSMRWLTSSLTKSIWLLSPLSTDEKLGDDDYWDDEEEGEQQASNGRTDHGTCHNEASLSLRVCAYHLHIINI